MEKNQNINDMFSKLGLKSDCTFAELDEAYKNLSNKYKSERFMEGEAGSNAAKNLELLDNAYRECQDYLKSRAHVDSKNIYSVVSELIKSDRLNDAQDKLDAIEYRDAEWHFYQSIIYYKKSWFEDSKKQLEISISLDPTNKKYSDAMNNLLKNTNTTQNQNQQQYTNPNPNQGRAGYPPPNMDDSMRNQQACCDTCCGLMCMDTCCECCGGDLISCC